MKKYPYPREPFPRQVKAMRMIYEKKTIGLFWEMGCGKTQVVLNFIGVMIFNKLIGQSLVICKLRGLSVWEDEIKKNMLPSVTYSILRPGPMPPQWDRADIILTNYDYARTRQRELNKWGFDLVAIDESHRIKNPYARQSRLAHGFKESRYRIILTGTPIGNRPLDLWSQMKFVKPGLLEEKFKDFKTRYAVFRGFGGYEIHRYRNLKSLAKIIHPYVSIERSTTGVKSEFIEVPVDMPPEAKKIYKQMEEEFVAYVDSQTTVSAPMVLAKLTKLSQISGGFIRETENGVDHSIHRAKLEALQDYCESLVDQGEKRVIVYARFLWEIDRIKEILAPHWTTYTIQGGVTVDKQKMAETLFREGGGAMICQTTSGSESLNLQSCRYTMFYSYNYSYIDFWQALKRTDRHGQQSPTCFYYIFYCRGTIDRRIYNILRGKKEVADQVRNLVENIKKERVSIR